MNAEEKDKTMQTGTTVHKSKKNRILQCVKLGAGSGAGSGSASNGKSDPDRHQCPLLCSVTCVQIFEKDFEDS